jgi:uncharacterized protein (DUF1800 family)
VVRSRRASSALSVEDVTLLIRRATFGRSASEIGDLVGRPLDDVVNELLNQDGTNGTAPKDLHGRLPPWQRADVVRYWWYDRMAFSNDPLREKMVLFLHGHFTTEFAKLYSPMQIFDQNQLFRLGAFGNLRALTRAICLQPAMLHYLDNATNVKAQPNENFAREIWELFLLGPGNYEQADVMASARAWTGHSTEFTDPNDADSARYRFVDDNHDRGLKTIFGKTAAFSGPDVIDWTFDGPKRESLSTFFVTKLWRFFTGQIPNAGTSASLASLLRQSWDLRDLLGALLRHDDFYSIGTREPNLRSPTELIVETMRATNRTAADLHPGWFADAMGQELFSPPTVAGWEGGLAWTSASNFYGRALFASNTAWVADGLHAFLEETASSTVAGAVDTALRAFGLAEVGEATRNNLERWLTDERSAGGWATARNLIILVMLSPEFQTA